MPDDVSRAPGQNWAAQNHASPHTSSHVTPLTSEPAPQAFPVSATPVPAAVPQQSAASASLPPFPGPPAAAPGALRVVVADDNPVVRAGLGVLLSGRDDIDVVGEATDGRQAYDLAVAHRPDVVLLDVRMPGVDGISALPHLVQVAPVMMLTYSRESEIVHEALRLGASGYLVHGEFTADQLVQAVRDTKDGRAHFTATAANALLAHMRQGPGPQGRPLPEGLGTALTTGVAHQNPGYDGHPPTPVQPHHAPARAPEAQPAPPAARPVHPAQVLSHMQPSVAQSFHAGGPGAAPNKQQFGLSSREVEVMELIASGMSNQQIAATCFISEKTVKNHINRIFTKLHSTSRSEAIARWLGTAPTPGPGTRGAGGYRG
ncbi:response regulator transcription factor [Streptomyces sp. NPDC052052]|uniref:response regulator transcription factor n=1 Tax=Streptomyces sp. NPDC052052 TaxID=3154756 RepID=UPI003425130C